MKNVQNFLKKCPESWIPGSQLLETLDHHLIIYLIIRYWIHKWAMYVAPGIGVHKSHYFIGKVSSTHLGLTNGIIFVPCNCKKLETWIKKLKINVAKSKNRMQIRWGNQQVLLIIIIEFTVTYYGWFGSWSTEIKTPCVASAF